jgi:hypothetical protein
MARADKHREREWAIAGIRSFRRLADFAIQFGNEQDADLGRGIINWINREPDDPVRLEQDLGLRPEARAHYRLWRRDAALLELRRRHFPELKGRPAATAVGKAVRRYQTSPAWLRDRASDQPPPGIDGDVFAVLMLGEDVPGHEILRRLFRLCDAFSGR